VALRGWLTSVEEDQVAVARKLHGFIYSLLTVTRNHLAAIESQWHGDYSIIYPFHLSQRYCRYPNAIQPLYCGRRQSVSSQAE
jgi:hypothetical protein